MEKVYINDESLPYASRQSEQVSTWAIKSAGQKKLKARIK
jgi:hypothetical protein